MCFDLQTMTQPFLVTEFITVTEFIGLYLAIFPKLWFGFQDPLIHSGHLRKRTPIFVPVSKPTCWERTLLWNVLNSLVHENISRIIEFPKARVTVTGAMPREFDCVRNVKLKLYARRPFRPPLHFRPCFAQPTKPFNPLSSNYRNLSTQCRPTIVILETIKNP